MSDDTTETTERGALLSEDAIEAIRGGSWHCQCVAPLLRHIEALAARLVEIEQADDGVDWRVAALELSGVEAERDALQARLADKEAHLGRVGELYANACAALDQVERDLATERTALSVAQERYAAAEAEIDRLYAVCRQHQAAMAEQVATERAARERLERDVAGLRETTKGAWRFWAEINGPPLSGLPPKVVQIRVTRDSLDAFNALFARPTGRREQPPAVGEG